MGALEKMLFGFSGYLMFRAEGKAERVACSLASRWIVEGLCV